MINGEREKIDKEKSDKDGGKRMKTSARGGTFFFLRR